jgi:MFS family permease
VLTRYRAAFEPRGSLSFSLAGLLGRLPASMVGLGLVLVVGAHGDYGRAGTLVGILALAACVGGPLQGRLADRFGQARTLVPTAAVFGFSMAGLILGLRADESFGVLALLAVAVGAGSPTTGTLARSRWTSLHPAGGRLQTAFAVEAVFDEVVFVTGPVLTTLLGTYTNPLLALVVAGAAGVVGSLLLAAQRRTEPASETSLAATRHREPATKATRARLPWSALLPLLVVQLTIGMIFGSTDVVTVAFASLHGERHVAGLILASFSAGSLIAGLVVGAVRWGMPPMRRVRVCVAVLGCATVLLPLVPNVSLLPLAGFAVGLTVSPALVAVAAAVQIVTPRDRLTEAMALGTSFLVAGFSFGSAAAGQLVDAIGPHRAFLQSTACGLIATLVVLLPAARRRGGRAVDRVRAAVGSTGGSTGGSTVGSTGGEGAVRSDATSGASAGVIRRGGTAPGTPRPMLPLRPPSGAAPTRSDRRGPGARRSNETARRP